MYQPTTTRHMQNAIKAGRSARAVAIADFWSYLSPFRK